MYAESVLERLACPVLGTARMKKRYSNAQTAMCVDIARSSSSPLLYRRKTVAISWATASTSAERAAASNRVNAGIDVTAPGP